MMENMQEEARRTRDQLLVLDCLTGDPGAWSRLVRVYHESLNYYVSNIAAGSADDIMQEVWLKAYLSIRKLKDYRALRPWLYRIARGTAIDSVRKSAVRSAEPLETEPVDTAHNIEFDSVDAKQIHKALASLTDSHREMMTLFFLEELTMQEISEVVEVPLGTVKSRLHHAKKALKAILTEMEYD